MCIKRRITERSNHTAKLAKKFEVEISPEKSETKAFLGQDPARCKIVVDKKCLQAKDFKYLGCEIYYENEKKN
jgi:hypothetical protein